MESPTVTDRSGQKETLIITRAELDHVNRALKGLHVTHWMARAYPEGDRSSGRVAIDIQYPPHAEETRDGENRKIKVLKGFLCIRPVGDGETYWVWGETQTGGHLGRRPPKE
jgi:hypothetical protein